jgi:hypothetical protein
MGRKIEDHDLLSLLSEIREVDESLKSHLRSEEPMSDALKEKVILVLKSLRGFLEERVTEESAYTAFQSLEGCLLFLEFTEEEIKNKGTYSSIRNLRTKYFPMTGVLLGKDGKKFHRSVCTFFSSIQRAFQESKPTSPDKSRYPEGSKYYGVKVSFGRWGTSTVDFT